MLGHEDAKFFVAIVEPFHEPRRAPRAPRSARTPAPAPTPELSAAADDDGVALRSAKAPAGGNGGEGAVQGSCEARRLEDEGDRNPAGEEGSRGKSVRKRGRGATTVEEMEEMLADFAAAHAGLLATGEGALAEVRAAAAAALAALLGEVRERAAILQGTGLQLSDSSLPGEDYPNRPAEPESLYLQSAVAVTTAPPAAAAAAALASAGADVEFGEADFTADSVEFADEFAARDTTITCAAVVACGAAAGSLAGPAAAVAAAQAVGFSSAGIVGGSWAASMMSASAIANGGGVASGSAVAVAQSIGALGALPAGMAAAAALAGGSALGLAGYGIYRLWRRYLPLAPFGQLKRGAETWTVEEMAEMLADFSAGRGVATGERIEVRAAAAAALGALLGEVRELLRLGLELQCGDISESSPARRPAGSRQFAFASAAAAAAAALAGPWIAVAFAEAVGVSSAGVFSVSWAACVSTNARAAGAAVAGGTVVGLVGCGIHRLWQLYCPPAPPRMPGVLDGPAAGGSWPKTGTILAAAIMASVAGWLRMGCRALSRVVMAGRLHGKARPPKM
jgi:hypothetical protein